MWWTQRLRYWQPYSFFLFLLITGCTEKVSQLIISIDQITPSVDLAPEEDFCESTEAYLPDTSHLEHSPVRYIRVSLHYMNSADSSKNYNYQRAKDYGEKLIAAANKQLTENHKMALPRGNETPVLPTRYQYKISTSAGFEESEGIYCHYDDDLYWFVSRGRNKNNYDRHAIKSYSIGLDSIINIFIVSHHPDSILSESYAVTSAGIALGNAVKIAGLFETRKPPQHFKGLINHEIGHVLGLRHSWNTNDGCNDTPRNPNCWMTTEDPPCDTMASNNLMDYNKHQNAWTPCQIGKIHLNMSKEGSRARGVVDPLWCTLNKNKTIVIHDSLTWRGAKDLEGNLVIANDGVLVVHCRLSIPPDGIITVAPQGKLILDDALVHNACGRTWQGIQVLQKGKIEGQVIYKGSAKLENVAITSAELNQQQSLP